MVPVRLYPDLHSAVKLRADAEKTSVSDLVRQALVAYLATEPAGFAEVRTRSGRVISGSELDAMASEADAGYDPKVLRLKRARRRPRAEIVAVRLTPELESAVQHRAELEATSVSDVIRSALYAYMDDSEPTPPSTPSRPRQASRPTEADTCRDYVVPRLKDAGWGDDQIVEQYRITDGRIVPCRKEASASRRHFVLTMFLSISRACQLQWWKPSANMRFLAKACSRQRIMLSLLDVPFAYSTNGKGIVEDDRNTGIERDNLNGFPPPDILWARYREWKGIHDDSVADGLLLPFNRSLRNPDGSVKEPRYYQRTAINRAVKAILNGDKRLLLTMATGTGKTFVSMQIVWKLWQSSMASGPQSAYPLSSGPEHSY